MPKGRGHTPLSVNGHGQLQQFPAVVAADGRLVVLRQRLHGGRMAGLRPDGGNEVDQSLRLPPGNDGTDGYLAAVHRGVDDTVLMQGPEQVIPPSPVGAGEVGGWRSPPPGIRRWPRIPAILLAETSMGPPSRTHKKHAVPATGLTSPGLRAARTVYHVFPENVSKIFKKVHGIMIFAKSEQAEIR